MCWKQVGEAQSVRKQIVIFLLLLQLLPAYVFDFAVSLHGIRYGSHPEIDTISHPKKRQT